jgi:hypothetical protein
MNNIWITGLMFFGAGWSILVFTKNLKTWHKLISALLILFAGIIYGFVSVYNGTTFNKKHYDITQKIEQKVVDGKIIKSDTLFVLIRKK